MRALIVDDDHVIRRLHKNMLKRCGLEVEVVENGREAVDLIHSGAYFHLILINMEMPVMNGLDATMILRAMGVGSVIVGITNYQGEREDFMHAGADVCYGKPLNLYMVMVILQRLYN